METVTIKTHSMVRTSQGTIPGGQKAGLPREEAEKLERAGHLTIVEEDEGDEGSAGEDIPDDYNDLRSKVSELEDRTGIEPDDYKKATLTEYVRKHDE